MSRSISSTLKQFIQKHKKLNYIPGALAILHTFGQGLKWHIHFHVLITAGGISCVDNKSWIENTYLNENYLKQTYKAKMLKGIRKLHAKGLLKNAVGKHPGQSFKNLLCSIYDTNWYIWLKRVEGNSTFPFIYISRYAKRACISQKGIIFYQKHKEIRWKERSKKPIPDLCAHRATPKKFIELLIQHIPDRYEHQIFYFGLYSSYYKNTLYQKAKKILDKRLKKSSSILTALKQIKLSFSQLMQWTHNFDPLTCSICKKPLELTGIIFLNQGIPEDKDLLFNYEIKNYELVKKIDTG